MPNRAVEVRAVFEAGNNNITVTRNNNSWGSTSVSPANPTHGATVNLTATPNSGYAFDSWQVISGGVTISNVNSPNATFTMPNNNVDIMANFRLIQNSPPDSWATTEVNAALAAELVPTSIASTGWQNATSRLTAADAIVRLVEQATGKTMAQIASERGWNLNTNRFSDTSSQAVTFLRHAGVTVGIGDNMYGPGYEYNRAEFVTMVGRASEAFFGITAQGANPFSDVPNWAAPYVGYAARNGITHGVGNNLFDSYGVLQNQHTAVFAYRTFNAWGNLVQPAEWLPLIIN